MQNIKPQAAMRIINRSLEQSRQKHLVLNLSRTLRQVLMGGVWVLLLSLMGHGIAADKVEATKSETSSVYSKEFGADLESFAHLSLQGVFIDGRKAEFMRRHGIADGVSGGVEDFLFEETLDKDNHITIEGRGLFDVHDYFFKFEQERQKIGFWSVGFKNFRSYYDGRGGFFPPNGQWISLFDKEMALDRGEAFLEGELILPDLPVFGFKYIYEYRVGEKDSLHWGDSAMTGGLGTRKIVPSFRDFNERRDIVEGYVRHTIDNTAFKAGLRYETTQDNNKLYVTRNQGETLQRRITTTDLVSSDLLDFYGSSETHVSDKFVFSSGYSLRTLDTDVGGSFIYGSDFDVPFNARFANRQTNDSGFLDLTGGAQTKQAIITLNAMLLPIKDLSITGGVKTDYEDTDGVQSHILTSGNASQSRNDGFNDMDFLTVTESLEARYAGIRDWAFYARAILVEGYGTITEALYNPVTSAYTINRDTELDRWNQKYTVGANWYPLSGVNVGSQYYHKINTRTYTHRNDNTANLNSGNTYPAFITEQDMATDDLNIRVTYRPLNNLTSVSRYDYQYSIVETAYEGLVKEQSGRLTSHIFSQGLTWSPIKRLYLQGNASVALARTETPANGFSAAVPEDKHNYLTTSFTSGYALDEITDLQATYSYYLAMGNYYDNSSSGVPYGSASEEHSVVLSMTRRVAENIKWTAKYGFFRNQDDLYGHNTDYDAHMIYTGLQVAF
jgi:hypothetical protein